MRPQQSKRNRQRQLPGRGGVDCPTPRKLAFETQEKAEYALKYMHFEGRRFIPHRAYLCDCGNWHLSSRIN